MHDRRSARFSISVLDVEPPAYSALKALNEQEQARERVRLWYVAATRARDLLVLPRHAATLPDKSWARTVDLDLPSLPALDRDRLGRCPSHGWPTPRRIPRREPSSLSRPSALPKPNGKSPGIVQAVARRRKPKRPPPLPIFTDPEAVDKTSETERPDVGGGATRGTILHKLMEEVLTGETIG